MKKTILVTGGAGYIGSHTVLDLIDNGYRVLILDNFSNSSPNVLKHLVKINNDIPIEYFEVDLSDVNRVEAIFEKNKIDAVIHFAGFKAVAESVKNPIMYYENNVSNFIKLIKIMQKYKVKNFVFSSSATVYGEPEIVPIEEKSLTGKVASPYARTKYIIEEILFDLCSSDKDFNSVSLRYFNPLGAHESGEIGEDPRGIPNNLAPFITQVAIGKLEKLFVFGNDYPTKDGTCVRDYVHVQDLAAGHTDAIKFLFKNANGFDVFNLGSGIGYSVFDIIKSYEQVIGNEIPFDIAGRRDGDLAQYYADISKAKSILGWTPKRDILKMCQDSWNWQSKYPEGYDF
jgi:UDP-glucose-4-epimerase